MIKQNIKSLILGIVLFTIAGFSTAQACGDKKESTTKTMELKMMGDIGQRNESSVNTAQ